jgi:hypothetical protein
LQDPGAYEDWRHFHFPTLPEVLEQFPSARPSASLFAALLSPLQPRFYSISSSPLAHPKRLHLTVAVVTYRTQGQIISLLESVRLFITSQIVNNISTPTRVILVFDWHECDHCFQLLRRNCSANVSLFIITNITFTV